VVTTALGTYRRRFWRVALLAALIMVPLDLVIGVLEDAASLPQGGSAPAWAGRVAAAAANVAAASLGTTFFAGVLDRIVAVDQRGEPDAPLLRQVRGVPVVRLLLVDLAASGLIVLGFVAFIVPGLVVAVLLGIVGPLVSIEDLRVRPALRRSVQLVRPHFFLTLLLVLLPSTAEESFLSWAEARVHAHFPLYLVVDVALTTVVASFVGILEITLAHGLIADHAWRRETGAQRGRRPEGPAAGPARKGPAAPGGGGAAG